MKALTLLLLTLPTLAQPLTYIDTSFPNASPLWYETAENNITLHLLYEHERASPNRAAGHIHLLLHAPKGTKLTLEFKNLDNIYNGRPGWVGREILQLVVSTDAREWKPLPTRGLAENRVILDLEMPADKLYIARVEPYTLAHLDALLASIKQHKLAQITPIGKTVLGRDIEIIRIGDEAAHYRVFLRARAHPWEAGTNWVVEGLVHRLLKGDDEAKEFLKRYCVYIMPLANKDGVARGLTRFNARGKDLNRNWDKPADPDLSPENHALEQWLEKMSAAKRAPHLALELHNDGNGKLHISRPPIANLERHLQRMTIFETLLRRHTWFTEGTTNAQFRNSGTLGEGWLMRYGIDAAVHEFNCNHIAGLKEPASAKHWQTYGAKLAAVFYEYFDTVKP